MSKESIMRWTKEKPTEDGIYWYRRTLNSEPTVISVSGSRLFYLGSAEPDYIFDLNGYFQGPVKPQAEL